MNEIKKAVSILELMAIDYTGLMAGLPVTDPMHDVIRQRLKAIDNAQDALREKADFVRCKDCEYWQDNNRGYPHEECRWGNDETPDADDFCSCGKRLEVAQG